MPTNTQNAAELTREQVLTTLVQPLEAASVFLSSGPRIIDTAGPLRIPFAPTFDLDALEMTGEGEQIPEVTPTNRDMHLLPSLMESFKVITRYSNEVLRQSFVSLDVVLRERLVAELAAVVDAQLLGATGDGITKPRGIGAYQGVQTLDVGGPIDLEDVLAAHGKLLTANAPTSGLTLFIRSSDYMRLRSLPIAAEGGWRLAPDPNTGALVVPILGAKVVVTDRIAAGTAYLVHMPSIIVARDVAPAVTILNELYGGSDERGIRAVTRLDAAPIHPQAVVKLTGITAAP